MSSRESSSPSFSTEQSQSSSGDDDGNDENGFNQVNSDESGEDSSNRFSSDADESEYSSDLNMCEIPIRESRSISKYLADKDIMATIAIVRVRVVKVIDTLLIKYKVLMTVNGSSVMSWKYIEDFDNLIVSISQYFLSTKDIEIFSSEERMNWNERVYNSWKDWHDSLHSRDPNAYLLTALTDDAILASKFLETVLHAILDPRSLGSFVKNSNFIF